MGVIAQNTGRSGTGRADPHEPMVECLHCGTPFRPVEGRTSFCCAGCEYVHRLISGQKLDRFYQLREGATTPVRSVVFQPRDYRWLEGLVKRAEERGHVLNLDSSAGCAAPRPAAPRTVKIQHVTPSPTEASLELDLQGISCVGCVWLIDRLFRDRPGARGIRVNATLGRMSLRWEAGACDVVGFAKELQRFGYLVGPASKEARRESSALLLRMGLCAAFAMNGMLFALPPYLGMEPDFPFAPLFTAMSFLFATASVAVGGTYFFARSWRSLRRGVVHIDLPISLGILIGYAGSIYAWQEAAGGFVYFDFVSTFTFLMIVGRWTQLAAVERNRNRLLGLNQDLPAVELIEDEAGDNQRVVSSKAASAIDAGDRFFVEPGQVVPVSASLLGPPASVGLDWISGESEARPVSPGQIVESGAINLSPHRIRLRALEPWGRSLLARLFAVQPPSEWRNRVLERLIRVYLLAVLVVAAIGGACWVWWSRDTTIALQVVVSVLVVSCPCALGVTLPLIDELAVARLRHVGVFVRSDDLWARLRRVRKVIFDKTGTLTLETLLLRNPAVLRDLGSEALAALARLVRTSRHPAAACIREAMMASGLVSDELAGGIAENGVREEVGFGLEWTDGRGSTWRLGRAKWAAPVSARQYPEDGCMPDVLLGCEGVEVARFFTSEEVRDDAVAEIASMRARGYSVFILSGDRIEKVAAMARALDLPEESTAGAMSPAGKADWVRSIDQGDTLMIGDGANDTFAFAAAACRGTPAVERGMLEHRSDFYFLGRGLGGINRLISAAATRHRTIAQVLAFAVTYNVAAVAIALAGLMSPLLAAVLMPASAIVSLGIAALGMRRV